MVELISVFLLELIGFVRVRAFIELTAPRVPQFEKSLAISGQGVVAKNWIDMAIHETMVIDCVVTSLSAGCNTS